MNKKQKNNRKLSFKGRLKRHFKLVLLPHKANQYRPHLVRRYGLLAVLLLVLGLQFGYNYSTTGTVLGSGANMNPEELLQDTNTQRQASQLAPLSQNPQLSRAAFLKAQDMFNKQYWAHDSPDGIAPWHWLGEVNYNYSHAGENLARGFRSADATTTAWMSSPEHRANLLSAEYKEVGYAVVDGMMEGKATTLVVALYGAPAAQEAVAGAATIQSTTAAGTSDRTMSPITRFGVAIQSLTPAAIGSMMLMLVTIVVAMAAHTYRNELPKALRQTWYRHHGMIKSAGMLSVLVIVIALYGGGQI